MAKRGKGLDCGTVSLVILVIVFTGLCVFGVIYYYRTNKAAAPFDDMEEEAQTLCAQCLSQAGGEYQDCNPGLGDLGQCPGLSAAYRTGKVLVVEADTGEAVGSTMADLSPGIGAANPEEVGTLACAGEVRKVQVSTYTDGEPGYRRYRDVCIYDVDAEEVILAVTLSGGGPGPVKTTSGPGYGPDPVRAELISLLELLVEGP